MKTTINLFFISCLLLGLTQCKSKESEVTKELTKEELVQIKKSLMEDGFFWQDDKDEFLFLQNGDLYGLLDDSYSRDTERSGKWYFDEKNGILQLAWKGKVQIASKVNYITEDLNEINFRGAFTFQAEYNSVHLKKMKLLDDRFDKVRSDTIVVDTIKVEFVK